MSWQKCMSFSKCSNLEAKNVIHFKLCHQIDKKWNYNLRLTKFRKHSFFDGVFMDLKIKIKEKFNLEQN